MQIYPKPNCLAWDCDFEEPAKKTFFRILAEANFGPSSSLFAFIWLRTCLGFSQTHILSVQQFATDYTRM